MVCFVGLVFMAIWYSQGVVNFLCMASSLGDQFEVYNNTLVHDAVSMVPDLAVQGNILVRTSKGKLYTTDTKTAIQLTTESELNITVIPNYVQTTSEDLIYVIRAKGFGRSMLCHCHFNRSSKVASALFVFYSNRCEQRCHKTLNRSFFKYAMKNIIVQRDERYDNTVFAISDRTYPATVVFINISDSYIYSNEAQKQLYFNTINTTGGIRFSILPRYYTINPIKSSDMHLQSIVQSGETSYLVYGHSVYRMEMPSKYSLTEIPVKFLSGGKTRGYVDSHFHTAQYSLLMDIVIINETMLAIADIGNNRIRLLNLQTYTTSTLCWMPRLKQPGINYPNNDEQVVQKTCALEKPQSLQFINDSLYVAWKGGFGRVYDSQPSVIAKREERSSDNMITIASVSATIGSLLTIGTLTIFTWRRKRSITGIKLRNQPEPSDIKSGVFELTNRTLPSISAAAEEQEQIEGKEGLYDMIGDQYYHTIDVLTTDTSISYNSADVVSDSSLDYFGYLKPTYN